MEIFSYVDSEQYVRIDFHDLQFPVEYNYSDSVANDEYYDENNTDVRNTVEFNVENRTSLSEEVAINALVADYSVVGSIVIELPAQ